MFKTVLDVKIIKKYRKRIGSVLFVVTYIYTMGNETLTEDISLPNPFTPYRPTGHTDAEFWVYVLKILMIHPDLLFVLLGSSALVFVVSIRFLRREIMKLRRMGRYAGVRVGVFSV